jgi:hypothetical protein
MGLRKEVLQSMHDFFSVLEATCIGWFQTRKMMMFLVYASYVFSGELTMNFT